MDSKPLIKFSLLEKMEFYADRQMALLDKSFPKIRKENINMFIKLAVDEMEGRDPPDCDQWDWQGLSKEAMAMRRLIQVLHREALHCDREEIMEYLMSLHMPVENCSEITAAVLSREIFSGIPQSIRIRPTLASVQWKIDISFCQRNPDLLSTLESKVPTFHQRARIILLLTLSNGHKFCLSASPLNFSRLKYNVARAIQACLEVDRRSQQPVRLLEEEREVLEERGETVQGAI